MMDSNKLMLKRAKALNTVLRKRFRKYAEGVSQSKIAIPMSAGVDSHCALFAALEEGIVPTVFSFHLKDVNSRDFRMAENTARHFDLKLVEVVLPNSQKQLITDVQDLAQFGCKSKTDFECFWPMWYLIPGMAEHGIKVFFTGHGADSLYCMSRKANQHFKGREDEFREQAFSSKTAFQRSLILKKCKEVGITYCPIFYDESVRRVFEGSTYADLHKPVQKAPSRYAFRSHFEQIKVYGHTSFQLGDSGISKHFEQLVSTSLNTGDYASVKGIYNSLVRKAKCL